MCAVQHSQFQVEEELGGQHWAERALEEGLESSAEVSSGKNFQALEQKKP